MNRDFKGIWIPKEIWLSTDLTLNEKLFLVEIDSLDGEFGCYASNDYFAKFFSLSKSRCSEIIKSLERKGYLRAEYIKQNGSKAVDKRVIRCIRNLDRGIRKTEEGIRNIDRPIRNSEEGYSENTKENNTLFNNTFNNTVNNHDDDNRRARESEVVEQNIYQFYQQNFGVLTPIIGEKIADWVKDLGVDLVKEALTRTLMNGTRSFNYAEAIMREWHQNNIKTLDQMKAFDLEYQSKRLRSAKSKSVTQSSQEFKVEPQTIRL